MPRLPELQSGLAAILLSQEAPSLLKAIVPGPPDAAGRLQIYRNHFRITLSEALAATYPVLCRLVGEAFFATAAREFVTAHPPAGPCLFEYGEAFPAFIAALPATRHLIYLHDVGRLEWALNVAAHAPGANPLDAITLKAIPSDRHGDIALQLHPSCRLIASPFPIDRIWQVNQQEGDDAETVHLDEGSVRMLVHRHDLEVGWQRLTRGEFAFLRVLSLGGLLRDAAEVALGMDCRLDLSRFLVVLLEAGAFRDVTIHS